MYDTCDEVRKKSLEFMASTGMTQTAFLREIASTAGKPTPVAPNSWGNFIKMKSAFQGHNPAQATARTRRPTTSSRRCASSAASRSR